jgi:hypothetical protein
MSFDPKDVADGIMARWLTDDWANPANGTVVAVRRAYLRDAIVAALTAYGDARTADMRERWQPIETAPKDARPVLCWSPDAAEALDIYIGYRIEDDEYPDGYAYFENSSSDAVDAQPTHWMPLPEPPAIRTLTDTQEKSNG